MSQSTPPGREGALTGFRTGVWLVAEGMALLRRERRLWALAALPVALAILTVGTATGVFWVRLDDVHAAWSGLLPHFEATAWWTWLWVGPARLGVFLLGWLAVLLSFAVALVGALLLANLLSAPFLDVLSERVEAIVRGGDAVQADASASRSLVAEVLRSFAAELQRLGFLGSLWLLLTAAGFVVPGAHVVTGPLLIALTVAFLPLDYAGFALDRRGVGFGERRRWLRHHLSTMLGFGGVAFLACLVPGLNLVILPILVTAGTLLVLRRPPAGSPSGA